MTDDVQDRTIADAPDAAEASDTPASRSDAPASPSGKPVPVVRRPSPANLRRQAKKEMARRAAEARRRARKRRQAFTYSGVAAVVVILLVGGFVLLNHGGKKSPAAANPSASSSAAPQASVSIPAELASKPPVAKGDGTVTALKVTDLVTGTGAKVESGQTITVNYVGVTYADGQEFDSSWKTGQPTSFQIGTGKVIPGWDQGLVGQTVGSRVQLDIPTDLAYGDTPAAGYPAGALRFVVDILATQ